MSVESLLQELQAIGVNIWPDGDLLRFKAPAGAMTPALTARLKASKSDLMATFTGKAARVDTSIVHPESAAVDLPLLDAIAEFDALIGRLCDIRGYDELARAEMLARRMRLSPDAVRKLLPKMCTAVRSGNR